MLFFWFGNTFQSFADCYPFIGSNQGRLLRMSRLRKWKCTLKNVIPDAYDDYSKSILWNTEIGSVK